jgi:hypothetical protein
MAQKNIEICKHPPVKLFCWYAFNYKTGDKDILCICCCLCGDILKGGAE